MNNFMTHWQYSICTAALAILFLLRPIVLGPDTPCILPPVILLLLVGYVYGKTIYKGVSRSWPLGIITALLLYPITITPLYWFFGYYSWYPLLISVLQLGVGGVLVWKERVPLPIIPKELTIHWPKLGLAIVSLIGPLFLTTVLLSDIFGDTILSPWVYLGKLYWLGVAISLAIGLYALHTIRSYGFHYLLLGLWYTTIYGVLLFSHPIAFGFDQHIHVASMQWILDHGLLEPKVPYYLGQYFLAIPVAELMNISLDWVSRALVPIGAALLLPYMLLQKKVEKKALLLLPILPLASLTFTTPNNLAILISLLTIAAVWSWWGKESKTTYFFVSLLIVWALITHAFIGLPLLVIVAICYSRHNWQRAALFTIGLILLPILLTLYGGAIISGFNLSAFFDLFRQPHYYIGVIGSYFWNLVYTYKVVLPLVIALVSIVGLVSHWRDTLVRRLSVGILMVTASSLLIASSVRFPALISYEQGDYAARLLQLCTVLCVPLFLLGLHTFLTSKRLPHIRPLLLVGMIPLLLVSYYFTYPTRDAISYYTGVNIRPADIAAIEFIESHTAGEPYIVLTNQTISAGALSTYGFDRYIDVPTGSEEYFYAIPTGGPLYQYFREYIYEGYDRKSIEDAMIFAGVNRAYLIHTDYWAPARAIFEASIENADNWWDFGPRQTWVYEYTK